MPFRRIRGGGDCIHVNFPYVSYQWDRQKDAENRRKHGLSLEDGIPALEDANAQTWIDELSHDEVRFVTVGLAYPDVLLVVTAQPSE